MKDGEHSVEITNAQSGYWGLDAIDIDKDGELEPYNPKSPTESSKELTLLRVTMLDSSERDYQLSTEEIELFVKWFTKHTSTDDIAYCLTKKVGQLESKEYLTFDKIISFEVIKY